MNVDTMRAIDRYVGVPLSFLGTLALRFTELFRPKPSGPPKNALFIELSEMGSAILVDPAMRKLRDQSGAELYFVIFSKNKASLDLLKTIPQDNIFTIDESGLLPLARSSFAFLWWCRKRKIDSVIDLELFSRFTGLLTGFSGARNRVGFHAFYNEGLYRGHFLTHRVAYNPHQHIAKNFLALVDALLAERAELPYTKRVIGDEELRLAKAPITARQQDTVVEQIRKVFPQFERTQHPLVLDNSKASNLLPQRRWASASFAQVIRNLLAADPRVLVLLTGAPEERGDAQEIVDAVQDERCRNFAGGTAFADLPHLYSLCTFMLTNDSGPAHFAATTSLHTFVIFGPETPALYGSLGSTTPIYAGMACSPCVSATNHRKTPCRDNQCVQVITPDQVTALLLPRLAAWDGANPTRPRTIAERPMANGAASSKSPEGNPSPKQVQ